MPYQARQTPQDAYTLTGLAAGTVLAIQNKSNTDVMVFAGDAAPSDPYDYFILQPKEWEQFKGDVCMVYAGEPSMLAIQEGYVTTVDNTASVTKVSNDTFPSFSNKSAGLAELTVANGYEAGFTYLFFNEANNEIDAVRL